MAPNRIIIDTDPGVDDILAMLLAFSAKPEELEILLLSITFGNVDVQNCLRNIVSMFHHIERERTWRKENGRDQGFEALAARKPIIAVGAEQPLAEQKMLADYFHGTDGLGGIHQSHPQFTPGETWKSLFKPPPESMSEQEAAELQAAKDSQTLFTPSSKPAHEEILKILKENDPGTITIVAIGPLTNLATAAAQDPQTFLKVKEVVVMGGAIDLPGNMSGQPRVLRPLSSPSVKRIPVPNFNLIKQPDTLLRRRLNERNQITPGAEFNTYADSVASARVFALTSPNPRSTMPPTTVGKEQLPPSMLEPGQLQPYPETLTRKLNIKLFPLDITEPHLLPQTLFNSHVAAPNVKGSPLSEWVSLFLLSTYRKMLSLDPGLDEQSVGLQLHDPLTIWYCITAADEGWEFTKDEDIRVETAGQWSRGTCVIDRRNRVKKEGVGDLEADVVGDAGGWKDTRRGNRLSRCIKSPGFDKFAPELLGRLFGGV
ncbi:nucleoside hydrolase [Corynespora cassiicola Philippines]|uniref:Nucleoside hydrolase n=1 Tax=Corynespora cassiicola Philippines TaxID=1448308 RepID=A0A2T2P599_CORCC|nr:nucleoside hydrolase [Corynespora cassiicola Philippines]